jgi:hypothetical protein
MATPAEWVRSRPARPGTHGIEIAKFALPDAEIDRMKQISVALCRVGSRRKLCDGALTGVIELVSLSSQMIDLKAHHSFDPRQSRSRPHD